MPVKKILIVDDSASDRHFLSESLVRQGYHCITAVSGAEAVVKSKTERPDLILMDVVMPGTNGFEATRTITRDEATRNIPVIICTAKDGSTDRLWGLRQGARDYVFKPIDVDSLVAKIAALG